MENGFFKQSIGRILGSGWLKRVKNLVFSHREQLLLLVGIIVVGVLAFEAGALRGSMSQSEPIILSLPAMPSPVLAEKENTSSEKPVSSGLTRIVSQEKNTSLPAGCVFVGSRNSDKYHLPTCAAAKRIKPENRVCFASKEDAEKRGYLAGCLK